MKASILFLAITVSLFASDSQVPAASKEIECRGVVEKFVKDGYRSFEDGGVCRIYDVTWIIVKLPEEFADVRYRMLTQSPEGKGIRWKTGDPISFRVYRSELEGAREREKKPNQVPEPTSGLAPGRGSS